VTVTFFWCHGGDRNILLVPWWWP